MMHFLKIYYWLLFSIIVFRVFVSLLIRDYDPLSLCLWYIFAPLCYFQNFLFITDIEQFVDDILWCGFFSCLEFIQHIVWGNLSHYFFKYILCLPFFRDTNYTYIRLLEVVPQRTDAHFTLFQKTCF